MSGRDLVTKLIGKLGVATLARRVLVRKGRFVLNFHGISSQRYSEIPHNLQPYHSTAEFRQVLAWLSKHFAFLSVEEFLSDTPRQGVLLTFDDGHANNLKNALPILTEYQAQGLFFVTTQHVQTPHNWLSFTREQVRRGWGKVAVPDDFARDCYDGLSEEQLVELGNSPWAVIGAHTVSHPSLPACSPEQIHSELTESRSYLQKVSGQIVDCFAYPYGYYNRLVAEAVRDAGYRAAFAVDPLPIGMPSYEIPRVGIYSASPDYLSIKLSGLHRRALHDSVLSGKFDK